jgi:acetyl-CoA carboxylase carboxyl transferase subunit beta
MNWLTNVVRPKIRDFLARRESPENLWIKCPETGQLVFYKDVEANQFVIPVSNYHMRMGALARMKSVFDGGAWEDIAVPEVATDPLKFRDERRYADRLKDARAKTGLNDAVRPLSPGLRPQRIAARRSSCSRRPAARGCRRASCR